MWNMAIEAHLRTARKLHSEEKISALAAESRFEITTRGNMAKSRSDAMHYLSAVEKVLGKVAVMSAKLKIMNEARLLGLNT